MEYDSRLLDTVLCWHFTVSVVVIQQFVESVTCLILGHIYRQRFGCVPFVKGMIQLSFEVNHKAGCNFISVKYKGAICAIPLRFCFTLSILESCGFYVIQYLFCLKRFLLFFQGDMHSITGQPCCSTCFVSDR